MAVRIVAQPRRYIGLASDTKPTRTLNAGIREGATFFEYDTGALYITHDATNWVLKPSTSIVTQVVTSKVIDASDGAYEALDVVNDDNCSTTATAWTFSNMALENGGYGSIIGATVFNETEGVTPRFILRFYNTATLSSQLTDNSLSTENKADRLLKQGQINFVAMESLCATSDASTTEAAISTVGGLPVGFKCASATKDLYGILITRDVFTQTATDDITIALIVEQF
ncbi:hypothetical protein LCGC14_1566140 [marine sediment metagenome]|uniref:Uncharacterized protein n=1 Tax=marine sediment metagenome TaxID=412755 RepID=A0A0F9L1Y0_9ZZZZ